MCLHPYFKKYFLFFFFLSISFSQNAFAQEMTAITVSPFILEEKVKPNQTFTKEIVVTNNSQDKFTLFVFLEDIRLNEKNQISFLPLGSEKFSFANWIEIPEDKLEIGPKESKKIKVHFKIPEKEAVGSRHGAIIFSSKTPSLEQIQPKEGVFVGFSHQVGVLVFLYSEKEANEEAKILKFKTDKKYYFTPFKIKFETEIENLGNVYLEPVGKIEITNFLNKKSESLLFNKERFKILPETKRSFEQTWQGKFGLGKYKAILYLTFGTPKNQGGSGVKTIFAHEEFWIFPLKEIAIIFIGVLLFASFIYLLIKRYKKVSQKIKLKNGD